MNIHLNQNEITEALRQYVENQGFSLADRSVEVSLTAGRGSNGHYADIMISDVSETETVPTAAVVDEDDIPFA